MDEVKEFCNIKFKVIIPTDREIWNDVQGMPSLKSSYLMQHTGCAKCAFHTGALYRFCGTYTDCYGHLPCFVPRLNKKQMQFTYCSVIDDDCKATVQ
jgi:hypothetical protein